MPQLNKVASRHSRNRKSSTNWPESAVSPLSDLLKHGHSMRGSKQHSSHPYSLFCVSCMFMCSPSCSLSPALFLSRSLKVRSLFNHMYTRQPNNYQRMTMDGWIDEWINESMNEWRMNWLIVCFLVWFSSPPSLSLSSCVSVSFRPSLLDRPLSPSVEFTLELQLFFKRILTVCSSETIRIACVFPSPAAVISTLLERIFEDKVWGKRERGWMDGWYDEEGRRRGQGKMNRWMHVFFLSLPRWSQLYSNECLKTGLA